MSKGPSVEAQPVFSDQIDGIAFDNAEFFGWNLDDLWNHDFNIA